MSLLTDYRRNYEQIAADHIQAWRATGKNPFQDPIVLQANENITFGNVTRHVPAGGSILDAGCGMGDLLFRLSGYECHGIDIAESYVALARHRGLDVRQGKIEKLPFPRDHFDGVIAADILEHVIDLHAAAKELVRVTRPGGYIILRVPNDETIDCNWQGPYEFIHLRTLDEGTLCILFCRLLGCEMVESWIDPVGPSVIHMVVRK